MTPCIYELLQPVEFILSRRISLQRNLLLAVSPKAVAYLLVPPPQSLAQIAALHPNIWLSYAAKMRPRYMGFMQLDHLIAGLQSNVT